MDRIAKLGLAGLVAAALLGARADLKEDIKAAAKKLEEQGNYSWTSTPKNEGGEGQRRFTMGPTDGKTEKEGFTCLTLKIGETAGEVLMKGGKAAVKTPEGWKTPEDLRGAGGEGRRNPLAMLGRMIQNYKTPSTQAAELVDKVKELKDEGEGASSGELTEDGVKSLLTMGFGRPGGGGQGPAISDTKGTAKFWVKDGVLVKYEYNVQGKISIAQANREFNINRTTTVEIKDVGSTKLEIPEEAKKKFE